MKIKITLIVLVIGFVSYCGFLVSKTCLFKNSCSAGQEKLILLQNTDEVQTPAFTAPQTTEEPNQQPVAEPNLPLLGADHGPEKTFIIGAADPCTENPKQVTNFNLN